MTVVELLQLTNPQAIDHIESLTAPQVAERLLRLPDAELVVAKLLVALCERVNDLETRVAALED